jgi:hypothetical protein
MHRDYSILPVKREKNPRSWVMRKSENHELMRYENGALLEHIVVKFCPGSVYHQDATRRKLLKMIRC